ncbi:MAG: YcaO-like family protein [Desulfobacteraceae bacterium]|nr:YcaO-like family protein [Desulfobacteraceae bacterium]
MRPNPLKLTDAPKIYQHDQDKVMTPEQTIARFKQRLTDTGLKILDDIVRIDKGRLEIPVYFSVCGPEARAAIGNYKQMGKGATPAQSQASAVMELGERFSLFSFYQNSDNFIDAPLSAIHEPTIAFEAIARSVDDCSNDLPVIRPFFNQLPLRWTWAHNLTQGTQVLVPFNWFWAINQFNGSSAGNCIEEALCQGICEVVERHVSALICSDRIKVPLIEPESVTDPVALELMAKYKKAGIQLRLSDFTLDMGIPSIGAIAWDPATFPKKSEIVWTAGTMPSAAKALCRALTEVAQLAGDFNSGSNYEASGLPKFASLEAAEYVLQPGYSVDMGKLPSLSNDNIKIEVENCIAALAARKMEVFTVDVRHPRLDIPAFYTIIPGAQFRERTARPSVGLICSKIITETLPPAQAQKRLLQFNQLLPGKYYIHFYLGQLQMNQGDYEAALASLRTAADLEPGAEDLASIYTYLGLCHKEAGRYGEALTWLDKADKVDPERTDTLNLMGFCHFKGKAYEQAIHCFSRVIALNPSSAIDHANIAVNYRALGQAAKAVEYYQLALSLNPTIDFAREHLAQMGIG